MHDGRRYQRKEVKIQEWESLQKSKFEAKLRQAEVSSIHSVSEPFRVSFFQPISEHSKLHSFEFLDVQLVSFFRSISEHSLLINCMMLSKEKKKKKHCIGSNSWMEYSYSAILTE